MSMKIDKIYIIHYKPLVERKKYLDEVLPKFNVEFEYRCKFDRQSPEINDPNLIDLSEKNKQKRNDILIKTGVQVEKGADTPALKACSLEHYFIFKEFVESDLENILIFEDDVCFDDKFFDTYQEYLKNLPKDYDLLFLGSGCGLMLPYNTNDVIGLHPQRRSRCGDSYMVSKKAATKIISDILPIYNNWDWELNYTQELYKMNIYWVTCPLIYQGSENGKYVHSYNNQL